MDSRTRWLAAGVAAAGLMALPAVPMAQSTTGSAPSQSYGQSSTENKSPRYHLDQAKRILDELSGSSSAMGSTSGSTTGSTTGSGTTGSGTTGSGTTGSQSGSMTSGGTDKASIVSELTRHFTQLEQAYERSRRETSTSGSTSGTTGSTTGSSTTGSGTTGSGTTGSGTTGSSTEYGSQSATGDSWMTHYSRLNQVLDRINVPKSSATGTSGSMSGTGTSGSTSGTGSGTTGSGTTGSTSGSMSQSGSSSLDASTMSKLREFRMHLDNFHTAAMAEAAGRR